VKKAPLVHLICVLALAGSLTSGLVAPAQATYSLVWTDEFNGAALNTADWSYDIGTGCPSLCGWGNNELQYYRSQNVAVTGGNLVIAAKAESFSGSSYTSGRIKTKGKRSFLYGRIEMRAKLPTGGGIWPAFWMMPEADVYGGWAASGEIDIMEAANATTSVGGTIHYGGTFPANTYSGGSYTLGGANFADTFHLYAVEWEPDAIRWYVDNTLYYSRTSAQWYSNGAPANPRAPFDQPFYIILNAAVGGNYTGRTSLAVYAFPQQYQIVRVYADIAGAAPSVSITAPGGAAVPTGAITIEATASDAGTIAGSSSTASPLGEDTTAPYSFVWNSVGNGAANVVARPSTTRRGHDHVDITAPAAARRPTRQPVRLPTRIRRGL
jgi:beta-glucanase (GH16 family)